MSALSAAVTRIRTWVASATTKSTNHYTITAIELGMLLDSNFRATIFFLTPIGILGHQMSNSAPYCIQTDLEFLFWQSAPFLPLLQPAYVASFFLSYHGFLPIITAE